MKVHLICVVFILLIMGCNPPGSKKEQSGNSTALASKDKSTETAPELSREQALRLSEKALDLLRKKDFNALAAMAHPEKGVRFSPYPHVKTDRDVELTPDQLVGLAESDSVVRWGHQDGSGRPIDLALDQYFDEYVYDAPFHKADSVFYNAFKQHGNAINNSFEIYPGHLIIEYHHPGVDPQYGGMDWKALRLVFAPYRDEWRLRAVIHAEWTI